MNDTAGALGLRIISGIALGVAALVVLYIGGALLVLTMAGMAAIAVHEWGKMILSTRKKPQPWLLPGMSFLAGLCVCLSALAGIPAIIPGIIFICACGAFVFSEARLALGFIYITFSVSIMVWLRLLPESGLYHLLTLLMIVWASDIAAYFSGRAIGGPKLAPAISPKKTWAGFIGSSCGAAIVAGVLATNNVSEALNGTPLGELGVTGYAIMGFLLAMVGQAGDLFISLFKRHYKIKDTGTLIPGHGGVLDRIDALLLVAIFFGPLAVLLS